MIKKTRIAAVLAAVMLAAGCGGDGSSSGTEGNDSDSATLDTNATLRISYPYGTNTFDPPRVLVSQYNSALFLAYDRLVHVDPEGNAIPGLATEWEFSEDQMQLTFTLREGLTFTDGTVFDGEAVKANLERARDLPDSQVGSLLAVITDITVDSPTQVTLTMSEPSPQLPLMLSERTGAMASPAAFDNPDLRFHSYGIGMYTVEEFVPDQQITFVRNEDYWDKDAAKVARIEFTVTVDPQTRLNAIRSGQADWTTIDPLDYQSIENDPNLESEVFTGLAYRNIPMNMSRPGLDNPLVRQALNYALDREAMSQVLTRGLATPCTQQFPPGYAAHNEELGCGAYAFDPERARELLEEAGYGEGELQLQILTGPPAVNIAELLQAMWEDIGATVSITTDTAATTAWNTSVAPEGLFISQWGGRNSPYETLFNQFTTTGPYNEGHVTLPEADAAYEAALNAATEEEQFEELQDMVKLVTDQALDIPLWFDPVPNVWTSNVVGVEQYATKQEFRGVGIAAGS